MLDHPVGSLADALVAAHGGNIGFFLDLFQRLFGALCTSGQSLIDIFLGGHQIFLLRDLQQSHVHTGGLLGRRAHLGGKALAGLVDLAQVAIQAQALHLQLLLDLLHLLLVGGLHQHTGQFALRSIGQLGQDLILGTVQRTGMLAVVQLLLDLCTQLVHGVHIGNLLGKVAVQSRDLAHTYVDQLDLEHDGFTGQILCVVTVREGDEDLEFLACLVAQNALFKAGDHAAAAQLDGLVLCGAALEGLALQQTFVIDMYDVALYGRTLVRHQLSGSSAAALQHIVDLLVGHFRGDALGGKAGGLGQVQLRLQGNSGSGHKALVLFHAHKIVHRIVNSHKAVLCHGGIIQRGHVLVHQIVDGIVPEGVLAAVSLDLCAVRFALLEAADRIGGAGAFVNGVGCSFQLFGAGAESHFADTLFGSFHAYQFHRIYPPWCLAAEKTRRRSLHAVLPAKLLYPCTDTD